MAVIIDNITNKYTAKLKKKYLNYVKYSDAVNNIKFALEETANIANEELKSTIDKAKEDIKHAIVPLKTKIAQKDEYISSQKKEIEILKNDINKKDDFISIQKLENNKLRTENQGLSTELESEKKKKTTLEDLINVKDEFISSQKYIIDEINKENRSLKDEVSSLKTKENINKPIIKEAYKQNLTQDIREKKLMLFSILSGLIRKKEEQNIPKAIEKDMVTLSNNKTMEQSVGRQSSIEAVQQVEQLQKPLISKKIIRKIVAQRKNQKIEKERIDKASTIIESILKDAPVSGYKEMQAYFNKIKNYYLIQTDDMVVRSEFVKKDFSDYKIDYGRDGNIIREARGIFYKENDFHPYEYKIFNSDNSFIDIYNSTSDSYIKWTDTNGKDLLEIKFNPGKDYTVFFSDKKGRLVVTKSIEGGVTKYLRVRFPDVQKIPEIVNDEPMNYYAEGVINSAKENCIKQISDYRDTTDIYYKDINGKTAVQEYKVKKHPVFTYIFNPVSETLEKLFCHANFGLHAKFDEKTGQLIQYNTVGITGAEKLRKNSDKKQFSINFYKDTENTHFETQGLYDENYKGDSDEFLQRAVYEKFNNGLASKPLTTMFTFHDLSKHKIKPWDFSILKPYFS